MKKYSSGSFVDAAVRVYGSEADTISSFPASIISDGENASAVIYGNMVQTGTPTAASPIYPSECGDLVSSNYIIPVISGGVTTNINFSAVQSTRQIIKVELTGTEEWTTVGQDDTKFFYTTLQVDASTRENPVLLLSSHYTSETISTTSTVVGARIIGETQLRIRPDNVSSTSLTDFKTFLQQQYSNNTPVTVWYVRAVPTTDTINEPLRKMSTYSDSVEAAAIPTTAGSQTFNVDTTLKPSSVSLTYTGWHTHADKQYSGGSWGALTSGQVLRRKRTTKKKT